jgi:hypothetical protein
MENYMSWSDDDARGMVFLLDLEYPSKYHFAHNSLPLAPESLVVNQDMLSDYSRDCFRTLRGKEKFSERKLVTTFLPKKEYFCHYQNLKTYLSLGMRITKVRRCISFKQSKFIKPFIDICTDMRKKAKTSFRKGLWKLYANSLFGAYILS